MAHRQTAQRPRTGAPGKRATNLSLSSDLLDAAKQLAGKAETMARTFDARASEGRGALDARTGEARTATESRTSRNE